MSVASVEKHLYQEISKIPLLDPHSHINPLSPAAKNLDEILGYHYYTELAHSAGMSQECLAAGHNPLERVRTILAHSRKFANTAPYCWFVEIAQTFLGFQGDHFTDADADQLWHEAEKRMRQPTWEEHVLKTTNVERIFLTNDFDDPLEGFNAYRYVPCLRTDDLVFHLHRPPVRKRLEQCTKLTVSNAQ